MTYENFIKEASKYSKEAILKSVLENYFIDTGKILNTMRWNDIQLRFDKLMAQSGEIVKKISLLSKKKDIKSHIELLELMEKDNSIHRKIDKTLKDMDNFNGNNS